MKQKVWQLQDAKNHFSEVVEAAMKSGAQTVTKHGKPAVVIVSAREYQQSLAPRKGFFETLRECPEDLSDWLHARPKDKARGIRFK